MPLGSDPPSVAETPVNNMPATPDEEGPVGFVNSVSSTSHPVPSPSNSAVSLATNSPVASSPIPRDIGATVVGSRENLESPSMTSHDSQNTNQNTTGARPKKKEGFLKKVRRWVGI
ncbi:hypothetical protein FRC04_000707 [Tulasnella sp. 424]|nr:hypothetical protein FRC04_000707 [Tulasnella sp. 424]KAG8961194.1 hypothetical protein FRC05_006271 [Tulasnella sp. 425]